MFNVNEILIIGIVLLMYRGCEDEYDAKILTYWLENTVNSIPGFVTDHKVDINLLTEKLAKLDIHQLAETFENHTKQVILPEFSWEEKVDIANCMCGSVVNGGFVQSLDYEVDEYYYYFADQVLSNLKKELVTKIKNLDYIQRVKLLYTVDREFFKDS